MEREKKKVIVTEIENWRKSKLLPEHYCDFLLNLYDDEATQKKKGTMSVAALQQGNFKLWALSFVTIALIFLIGFYFPILSWPFQAAGIAALASFCYGLGTYAKGKAWMGGMGGQMLYAAGSLVMLGLGAWMIRMNGWPEDTSMLGLIAVCAVVWLGVGMTVPSGLLHYCGWGALILLYAKFFGQVNPGASWPLLQLLWIPLSALLLWLSWLAHHKAKRFAAIYFAVGVTLWFMPELDDLLLRHNAPDGIVLLLLGKLALAFILLFFWRKKWIAWVSV
ncbi:hypothetical protein QWJ34_05350 [Saccharibacillus sp. CPCC 101409]|uniref:hypothetical protein n=1 Tax=Saccharibacillus sp. CPCC 101409 TaxID=3058041 RepID=UPI0026741900|nr:hypothetical protein [Saccharibacillus sp. CPCC 101409]MDO3409182.1 hypothetical protein [Saccharibacillus sp. CPCC 101409]